MVFGGVNDSPGRYILAQVSYGESVTLYHYFHNVLAYVVDITLYGGDYQMSLGRFIITLGAELLRYYGKCQLGGLG